MTDRRHDIIETAAGKGAPFPEANAVLALAGLGGSVGRDGGGSHRGAR